MTFASLGVHSGSVTVLLMQLSPMLCGRLDVADLHRLLLDDIAMDQAIDAYKENPLYSAAEVDEIVAALAAKLLPNEPAAAHEVSAELLRDTSLGLSSSVAGRAKEKARFSKAVRAALLSIQRRLRDLLPAEAVDAAGYRHAGPEQASAARVQSADPYSPSRETWPAGPEQASAAGVRSADPHSPSSETERFSASAGDMSGDLWPKRSPPSISPVQMEACPLQWKGAGSELRTILHRRFADLEGKSPSPESQLADSPPKMSDSPVVAAVQPLASSVDDTGL